MQHLKAFYFFPVICLLFLSACISDDITNCPPQGNVTIHFDYPEFYSKISRVNIGIFNSEGTFVTCAQIESTKLHIFQGERLNLPDGKYTAICWGNVFDKESIQGFAPGSNLSQTTNKLISKALTNNNTAEGIDSIYFARKDFQVSGLTETTLTYNPAYIRFNVQIKGLSNIIAGLKPEQYPFIRVRGLSGQEDFNMLSDSGSVSCVPPMKIDAQNMLEIAEFNTFNFRKPENIIIEVINNHINNTVLQSYNLSDLLSTHHIKIIDGKENILNIRIVFYSINAAVVTLNDWAKVTTSPDI